ncbi:hypothetical protein TRVA0_002S02036 [Trichomonascus vanleenenianus]|uniref:uncharacterized protein n=1 Tax=Trichomonascus vanleenenianus TaxID=2268995 RepID=UPI003ECB74E1
MMPSVESSLKALIASCRDADTPEARRQAVQKLGVMVVDNIRSGESDSELDSSSLALIKHASFELLKDHSIDVQFDAFTVLVHAAILEKRNSDDDYRKVLKERQSLTKPRMPLGMIDFALVFDLAMDVFESEPQDHRELFYHVFSEFASSGRKFVLC